MVFSSFALAYALFEIPGVVGRPARRAHGARAHRRVWWSAFTMATAGTFNHLSMVVTRFLFPAWARAGAWPCVARVFALDARAAARRDQGIFAAGAYTGRGRRSP